MSYSGSGPNGAINSLFRSTEGTTLQRFGRSYVFFNPSLDVNDVMPGTWNLMYEDEASGGSTDPFAGVQQLQVVLANPDNSSTALPAGTLIYVGNDGLGYKSQANNPETAKVAGALLQASVPGTTALYARNAVIDIFDTATLIDGTYSTLIPNQYYYLSDTTAGNYTLAPDTTSIGQAVIQVGQAVSASRMAIETQQPTLT